MMMMITLVTKLQLYQAFILYAAETWSHTQQLDKEPGCIWPVVFASYTESSLVGPCLQWRRVCQHTKQLPLTHTSIICTRCLKLLGHNVQVSPSVAHNWALQSCLNLLLTDWNCRPWHLRLTWLRMVESDLHILTLDYQWLIVKHKTDKLRVLMSDGLVLWTGPMTVVR